MRVGSRVIHSRKFAELNSVCNGNSQIFFKLRRNFAKFISHRRDDGNINRTNESPPFCFDSLNILKKGYFMLFSQTDFEDVSLRKKDTNGPQYLSQQRYFQFHALATTAPAEVLRQDPDHPEAQPLLRQLKKVSGSFLLFF